MKTLRYVFMGLCLCAVALQYHFYLKANPFPYGNDFEWRPHWSGNLQQIGWADYLNKYGVQGEGNYIIDTRQGQTLIHPFKTIKPDLMWGVDGFSMQMFYFCLSRWSMRSPAILNATIHVMWFLATFFWFLYFLEITENAPLAMAGWAILAWLPSWSGSFYRFYTETLLLPALGLALYLIWRAARLKNLDAMIIAMLAVSFAMHAKQTAAPDVLIATGWMFWKVKDWKKIVAPSLVLLFFGFYIPGVYFHHMIGTSNPLGELRFNQLAGIMGPRYVFFDINPNPNSDIWLARNHGEDNYFGPMTGDDAWNPLAPFSKYEVYYGYQGQPVRTSAVYVAVDVDKDTRPKQMDYPKESWSYLWHGNDFNFFDRLIGLVGERLNIQVPWPIQVIYDHYNVKTMFLSWIRNIIMGLFDDYNHVGYMPWEWKYHRAVAFVWAPLLLIVMVLNLWIMHRDRRHYFTPCLCMILWFMFLFMPTGFTHGRYRKPFEGQLIGNVLWLVAYAAKRRSVDRIVSEAQQLPLAEAA